jgi:hypothetical protein
VCHAGGDTLLFCLICHRLDALGAAGYKALSETQPGRLGMDFRHDVHRSRGPVGALQLLLQG